MPDLIKDVTTPVTSYPVCGTKATSGPTTVIPAPGAGRQIIVDGITLQAEVDGDQTIIVTNTAGSWIQRLFVASKAQGISRSNIRWPQGNNHGVSISLSANLQINYTIYYHVEDM